MASKVIAGRHGRRMQTSFAKYRLSIRLHYLFLRLQYWINYNNDTLMQRTRIYVHNFDIPIRRRKEKIIVQSKKTFEECVILTNLEYL